MTDLQNKTEIKQIVEQAFDVYGTDFSRMPPDLAARVKTLVEETQIGKALFADALALEAALDQAVPLQGFDMKTLENNILDQVFAEEGRGEDKQATILDFKQPYEVKAPVIKEEAANDNRAGWLVASSLCAASLLLGIFLGTTGAGSFLFGDGAPLTIASADVSDDIFFMNTDINFASDFIAGAN